MNRSYIYSVFAVTTLGFFLILFSYFGNAKPLQAEQEIQTINPPFSASISGIGIVEPISGKIMISSPLQRRVETICVKVNDQVKKGDLLFQLQNEDLKANLQIAQRKYAISKAQIDKIQAAPQEEDRIIAQENARKAQSKFHEALLTYCLAKRCAISKQQKCVLFYQYQQAEAEYFAAEALSKKVLLGAWQPDLDIACAELALAKAEIEGAEEALERTYITSPIEGTVLQISIREGEVVTQNAMIVGNMNELKLRVSIDQLNVFRFSKDCPAVAYKQGDPTTKFPLTFLQIEPVMVPKKYISNELNEKVDTQVFEVVYRIDEPHPPLLIGEQMDVYISFGFVE